MTRPRIRSFAMLALAAALLAGCGSGDKSTRVGFFTRMQGTWVQQQHGTSPADAAAVTAGTGATITFSRGASTDEAGTFAYVSATGSMSGTINIKSTSGDVGDADLVITTVAGTGLPPQGTAGTMHIALSSSDQTLTTTTTFTSTTPSYDVWARRTTG